MCLCTNVLAFMLRSRVINSLPAVTIIIVHDSTRICMGSINIRCLHFVHTILLLVPRAHMGTIRCKGLSDISPAGGWRFMCSCDLWGILPKTSSTAGGVSQLAHYEEEVRARAESTSSLSDPDKVWFVVYS